MGFEFDFSELQAKLEDMDKKISKQITDDALKKAAEVVLQEQLKEVPKDTHKLEHSLKVGKLTGTGVKRKVLIGIDPSKAKQLVYGFYQEYGTVNFAGKKWMKKSWLKTRSQANQKIAQEIRKGLGLDD